VQAGQADDAGRVLGGDEGEDPAGAGRTPPAAADAPPRDLCARHAGAAQPYAPGTQPGAGKTE
jgi:hypothetical protein